MKRLIVTVCALAAIGGSQTAPKAGAASVCVGSGTNCFATIQAAIDAAHNGDVISIGAGTFAGGVTIDKSVSLIGAGADATIISGGGPVLTIGVAGAPSEPTVTIDGVTVTGGVTIGNLTPFSGRGGGIYVPRAAGPSTGATVTIRNSVIRGNRVAPSEAIDSGIPCPGGSDCPFASAAGGGISNDGTMTLDHTVVRDNRADAASGLTSDANGGGILNRAFGTLTLKNSVVTDNHAEVTAPNGRFAEGGGILSVAGRLTIDDSVVSGNNASLSSTLPYFVGDGNTLDMSANGGGIHANDESLVTIEGTRISGNTVSATDPNGEPLVFDAGLLPGARSTLVLRNSILSDNHVIATVGSSADVEPSGSALDIDGPATIGNTRITGNTTIVTSPFGAAAAAAAVFGGYSADNGAVLTGEGATPPALIRDSVISGNSVRAVSGTGSASVYGAGILNNGLLELRDDQVSDNSGTATGPAGFAQGGGIWNGAVIFAPPVQLTLENTNVTHNTLSASPGLTVQGGGLFTTFPVTLNASRIANNIPDQCVGC